MITAKLGMIHTVLEASVCVFVSKLVFPSLGGRYLTPCCTCYLRFRIHPCSAFNVTSPVIVANPRITFTLPVVFMFRVSHVLLLL